MQPHLSLYEGHESYLAKEEKGFQTAGTPSHPQGTSSSPLRANVAATQGQHEGRSPSPNTTGISQCHGWNQATSWRMTVMAFVGNEASQCLESDVCLGKGEVCSTYADTELKWAGWMKIKTATARSNGTASGRRCKVIQQAHRRTVHKVAPVPHQPSPLQTLSLLMIVKPLEDGPRTQLMEWCLKEDISIKALERSRKANVQWDENAK